MGTISANTKHIHLEHYPAWNCNQIHGGPMDSVSYQIQCCKSYLIFQKKTKTKTRHLPGVVLATHLMRLAPWYHYRWNIHHRLWCLVLRLSFLNLWYSNSQQEYWLFIMIPTVTAFSHVTAVSNEALSDSYGPGAGDWPLRYIMEKAHHNLKKWVLSLSFLLQKRNQRCIKVQGYGQTHS